MKGQTLFDGDTFTHRGYEFRVSIERDDFMGEPWKEHDGHGIVSEWVSRAKYPEERILCSDRGSYRYYDVAATMRRALKEHWGPVHCTVCGKTRTEANHTTLPLVEAHDFTPETRHQTAARAVEADYERLRAWCHDEWEWISIVLRLVDGDEVASLSGIESDAGEYLDEAARELADEIVSRIEVDEPHAILSEN